jgi:hypothetical protein
MANCAVIQGIPIFQGIGTQEQGFFNVGTFDPASCGTNPSRTFWAVSFGNPVDGLGVDSGASISTYDPLPGFGYAYASDWGNDSVDGCIADSGNLQGDGSFGPMMFLLSNGAGEGTSGHGGNYSVLSIDYDNAFQAYNLDQAYTGTGTPIACAPLPIPVIDSSSGSGPFSVTAHWGGVSVSDDCATNAGIDLASDPRCGGSPSAPAQTGWKVYSKSAPCTVGTLTSSRSAWTQEGPVLAVGANAGTTVPVSAAASGECRFVAANPVFDSGFEPAFLSGQSTAVGGGGNADGDGFPDATDKCPLLASGNNADGDGDGVGDVCDNCPVNSNPSQSDSDNDGAGDACDICSSGNTDLDGDGVCSDVDNCPSVYNPTQADGDGDGLGDACDACTGDPGNDPDGDGICSGSDNCPNVANPAQANADGDADGDACDACPYEALNDQDGDGKCACDVLLFNAGTCVGTLGTTFDNCPTISNANQAPSGFGDGYGAVCDERFATATTGTFRRAIVRPTHDQGFGDCTITWSTNREFNCPTFNVVYRGAGGDRDTGISAPCSNCTGGNKNRAYGGTGRYIAKCHGGHGIVVQANRTVTTTCGTLVNYKTVVGRPVFQTALRLR